MIGDTTMSDEYNYPLHMTGQATTLPTDDDNDIVERLRKVVEEVTGKPVPRPARNPIGFVW